MYRIYNFVLIGIALTLGLVAAVFANSQGPMSPYVDAFMSVYVPFFMAALPILLTVALVKYILKD